MPENIPAANVVVFPVARPADLIEDENTSEAGENSHFDNA
jgi:hypothetical protein